MYTYILCLFSVCLTFPCTHVVSVQFTTYCVIVYLYIWFVSICLTCIQPNNHYVVGVTYKKHFLFVVYHNRISIVMVCLLLTSSQWWFVYCWRVLNDGLFIADEFSMMFFLLLTSFQWWFVYCWRVLNDGLFIADEFSMMVCLLLTSTDLWSVNC